MSENKELKTEIVKLQRQIIVLMTDRDNLRQEKADMIAEIDEQRAAVRRLLIINDELRVKLDKNPLP